MWVPKHLATMPMTLKIYDGLDENGGKNYTKEINVKAAVFNDFSTVYTSEGERKTLAAKAYIFEKLDEFEENMSAICLIKEEEYLVISSSMRLDISGNRNHFELGLM